MRKDTENWIKMADYDLETAGHMLATGRYLYVVFMCHLSLEKMLKAHVTEVTQAIPPRSYKRRQYNG
jgi:HEPN domain-containing protein